MKITKRFALAIGLLMTAWPILAASTEKPLGPVLLTVSGAVTAPNAGHGAQFDLAALDAFPQHVTETDTPWYQSRTRFQGPLGSDLLKAVGAKGTVMRLIALNDYAVEIPLADFMNWPVILATRVNDNVISVRDKGPIFVIYPFDRQPSLYNEVYFGRSIWQLKSIEIR